MLFVDITKREKLVGIEDLLRYIEELGCCHVIDSLAEIAKRLRAPQMKQSAPHGNGNIFAILPRQSSLSLQLALGCRKGRDRKRGISQSAEFVTNQVQTTFHILVVAAEISCP